MEKKAKESQLTSDMCYKYTSGKIDERIIATAGEKKCLV